MKIEIILALVIVSVFLIDFILRKRKKASTNEIENFVSSETIKRNDKKPILILSFVLIALVSAVIYINNNLYNGFLFEEDGITVLDHLKYDQLYENEVSFVYKKSDSLKFVDKYQERRYYTDKETRAPITGILYDSLGGLAPKFIKNGFIKGLATVRYNGNYLLKGSYYKGFKIGEHIDYLMDNKLRVLMGSTNYNNNFLPTRQIAYDEKGVKKFESSMEYDSDASDLKNTLRKWYSDDGSLQTVANFKNDYLGNKQINTVSYNYRYEDSKRYGGHRLQDENTEYERMKDQSFFLVDDWYARAFKDTPINNAKAVYFDYSLSGVYIEQNTVSTQQSRLKEWSVYKSWNYINNYQSLTRKVWKDSTKNKLLLEEYYNVDPPNLLWGKIYDSKGNNQGDLIEHYYYRGTKRYRY
tara:strand:- start:1942 stop:3177 length:1236 start_codon:yes stop_codon:yes gene_type:complete